METEVKEIISTLEDMADDIASISVVYTIKTSDGELFTGIAGDGKLTSEWCLHSTIMSNYVNEMIRTDTVPSEDESLQLTLELEDTDSEELEGEVEHDTTKRRTDLH